MKFTKTILAGAALVAAISAGTAAALDSSREVYLTAGTHQFYVWCTGGAAGTTATQDGANAEDAQLKLFESLKAGGKANCWPIWQGKV
jgi:Spy/CpxP family protein refolding chaperone